MPSLEQACAEYIAAAGRGCDVCGERRDLEIQLREPRRPWSPSLMAEEFAKAPLLCKDCRGDGHDRLPAALDLHERVARLATRALDGRNAVRDDYQRVESLVPVPGPSPGSPAVTAYLSTLAPNSRRGISDALERLAGLLGSNSANAVAWHRLTYGETAALQAKLVASGLTPDYAKKHIGALRGVLKASKRLGLMTSEQYERATELERIRGSRIRNVKNLRPGDLESLLAATRDDEKPMRSLRDRALLALLAGGGLRRAEAASVTTAHLNRSTRTLLVRGKGDKERIVPLPQWAARALAEFVDARGFDGPLLCPVSQRDEAQREPLAGGQAVYVVLHRLVDRAGLTAWTPPHGFRRAFGTGLLRNGTDVFLVSKLLGHANPATTAKAYDTRGADDFAKAVDALPDPENRE